MPAGIVRSFAPTAVMPLSLSRAFTEAQSFAARVNEYHDGTSHRSAILDSPRRSWQLTKRLSADDLIDLREFWQEHGAGAFWFYNPKETTPPFSYDPTGAATAGRFRVRFASAWSQSAGVGRLEASVELVELFRGALVLLEDLALLIDKSGSVIGQPLANEKAAACSLVDGFAPLLDGGIAVYEFGAVHRRIDVSRDATAIKAAINGITGGGDTPLYDCIYTAATATTAKTLVLMTDGADAYSASHNLQQAIAACVAAGIKAYAIGFGSANQTVLQAIAAGTGGIFYPAATSQNLAALIALIMSEIAE